MSVLVAAAQAMEAEDSENDNLMIQEDNENESGARYQKKEEMKLRDELSQIKTDIDDKGTVLTQVFNELSGLLSKYNARLSAREDFLHIREYERKWSKEADAGESEKLKSELLEKERLLSKYENDLKNTKLLLKQTQSELEKKISHVTRKEGELTSLQNDLKALHSELVRTQGQLSLKNTLHEKLQVQMQEEAAKFKKELSRLQTALYVKTGLGIPSVDEASHQDFINKALESSHSSPARDDTYSRDLSPDAAQPGDQTVMVKQEPYDPDDQILIQNNQTQQVTLLKNTPVITNIQKVVPATVKNTNTNPSPTVTVYVQSTPSVPSHVKKTGFIMNKSGIPQNRPVEPDPNQKFSCSRCGKRFIEWLQLQKHLETHSGSRPYKCKFCDKTFRQKYVLDTHMRTHTGERPFKCDQCMQAFGQKATLLNHMRTHTGEKPYLCELCDKSFAQLSSLQAHARTHEKDTPLFTCEHCGSILADRIGYLRHLRTVHKVNTIEELKPVHLLAFATQGSPLTVPTSPKELSNEDDTE